MGLKSRDLVLLPGGNGLLKADGGHLPRSSFGILDRSCKINSEDRMSGGGGQPLEQPILASGPSSQAKDGQFSVSVDEDTRQGLKFSANEVGLQ